MKQNCCMVGNPTTDWREDTANYDIGICNNYIYHTGYEYPTAVSVYVSMADGLNVKNNLIKESAYTAISAGWGWLPATYDYGEKINVRNAEIAYNLIEDFMQVSYDGAAIYVLGGNCAESYKECFNEIHDNFAVKSSETSTKMGYYLDGSASHWHVYNNVISGSAYPVYSQYNTPGENSYNNLIEKNYSTEAFPGGNESFDRNVVVKECFTEPTLEALYKKYPNAKSIEENAGLLK